MKEVITKRLLTIFNQTINDELVGKILSNTLWWILNKSSCLPSFYAYIHWRDLYEKFDPIPLGSNSNQVNDKLDEIYQKIHLMFPCEPVEGPYIIKPWIT